MDGTPSNYDPELSNLRFLLDSAPVGIIQLDAERRYVSANASFLHFLGYTFEELRELTMFDVTHPEDREASREQSDRVRAPGFRIHRLEKRYIRKDGAIVWGLVTSQQVPHPITGGLSLFTVVEDITELKARELELKRAEMEIANFFVASVDVMCAFSTAGILTRVNSALLSLFGYNESELLGKSILEFIHPDEVDSSARELARLGEGQASVRFENRCRARDGSYRLLSWNAVPDAESDSAFAIGRDITERKRDEARLTYSAKMASLGEMAGGIAHEVNNPLAIIMGKVTNLLDLLDARAPDLPRMREELRRIESMGERIARIIRGLRAFSRNGERDSMNTLKVAGVINETLTLCSERLRIHNIEVIVHCPQDLEVKGRPSQLSQVLMNLLSNSFDAVVNQPAPWIRIEAVRRHDAMQLLVTDSGPGIEPRVAEKIFQPFFTTKDVGKGTGLGLSISKGIIEEHGGTIRYENAEGHTRFVLDIPAG